MQPNDARREQLRMNARRYRQRHPERVRESNRRWRAANPERAREINRLRKKPYYAKNRERILNWQRDYTKRNYERLRREWRDYASTHREQARARAKAWYWANRDRALAYEKQRRAAGYEKTPARRAKRREWVEKNRAKFRETLRVSRAKRRAQGGRAITTAEWLAIMALWQQRCAYCGEIKPLVIEHAVPLSRGGTNARENILPACAGCNAAKGTRTEGEFRLQRLFEEPFDVPYVVDGVAVPIDTRSDEQFVLLCNASPSPAPDVRLAGTTC